MNESRETLSHKKRKPISHMDLMDGIKKQELDLELTELKPANLGSINLKGAILNWAVWRGSSFDGANMDYIKAFDADFTCCTIEQTSFQHADLRHASFVAAWIRDNVDFRDCCLNCANFRGAVFDNIDFKGVNLSCCNFRGATFVGCLLQDAEMIGADFTGAHIIGSSFPLFSFRDWTSRARNITGAKLQGLYKDGYHHEFPLERGDDY